MDKHLIYFAHGKESGPWGEKIVAMAEVAKNKGFQVESPDYSTMMNPEDRVKKLLQIHPQAQKHLVLVGSSMGGYVSAVASESLKPKGLFLLAPAFFRAGYQIQNPKPHAPLTMIVHGWQDEVIPVDDAIRYARDHRSRLLLVDSDHRLTSALPQIREIFSTFLDEILQLP